MKKTICTGTELADALRRSGGPVEQINKLLELGEEMLLVEEIEAETSSEGKAAVRVVRLNGLPL